MKTALNKAHDLAAEFAAAQKRHARGPHADKQHVGIEDFARMSDLGFRATPSMVKQAKQLVNIYAK